MENFLQVIPLINYLYSPHRKGQWLPRWPFLMHINTTPSKQNLEFCPDGVLRTFQEPNTNIRSFTGRK